MAPLCSQRVWSLPPERTPRTRKPSSHFPKRWKFLARFCRPAKPPGQYVIKLVDSESNRHIVQFLNADETVIYNTVVAIPNERMRRTGKTAFTYYEMPAGHPVALKAWFYPGDVIGQEFAYPASRDGEFFQPGD